jgi:DNA-binding transcriptional LysR family regulator
MSAMTDTMDSLGSLNVFVQAAEARGFSEAGRRLGVSSSAIGKAIARLEERLGVRLFHRSTRTVTLTAEGALFLERCRRIFCEIEAAELELAQTQGMPRGRLRISLPQSGLLFMPRLAEFQRRYPAITLDIDCSNRLVDVIEEGFDAVLRTGETRDSRLMMRTVGCFRQIVVGAPDYFHRAGTPKQPEDLLRHACLMYRSPTSGKLLAWPLRRGSRAVDVDLPASLVTNALEPQLSFAELGLGIACVPDFTVRRQLAEGRLVSVLDDYLQGTTTLRVLWPSSRHLSPKLRVFIDFMADNLLAA